MSGRPSFLLAPGAGAPSTSGWMRAWADRLAGLGDVTAFDYPYMRAGRKAPDKLPVLVAAHREALAGVRAKAHGAIFLVGKSMGGRVGCHLALDETGTLGGFPNPPATTPLGKAQLRPREEPVSGVICLGYPLRAGATGALRDEVLVALRTPVLFVQGTRDPLCPLETLAEVRARMAAPSTLVVVEGGDHSLVLSAAARKSSGTTQADADAGVLDAIRRFCTV